MPFIVRYDDRVVRLGNIPGQPLARDAIAMLVEASVKTDVEVGDLLETGGVLLALQDARSLEHAGGRGRGEGADVLEGVGFHVRA